MRFHLRLLLVCGLLAAVTIPAVDASPSHEGGAFYIVHFQNRITDPARSRLEQTGMEILDYIPRNSYVAWGTAGQARAATTLREIEQVSAVVPEQKFHSDAFPPGLSPVTVDLSVRPEGLGDLLAELDAVGDAHHVSHSRPDGSLITITAVVPSVFLSDIAARPAVLSIDPASPGLIPDDEAGGAVLADHIQEGLPAAGYRDWLKDQKLDGKGVIVAIVDTGIEELHPALAGRVVETYQYGADPGDTFGHGTHVAGIVGGNPPDPFDLRDSRAREYGLGVAPAVQFVDQNALSTDQTEVSSEPPDPDRFELYSSDAWKAGARMWNASWNTGEGARVGYTPSTRMMDVLTRDAVFGKRGQEEFLLVFSAGNSGQAGPTAPHEAKNIIAVGATMSGRGQICQGNNCVPTHLSTSDIDRVASFSSRGPTKDGRIFPTVSAPGGHVVSTRAPEAAFCNEPPHDSALLYAYCSGTSMAAPHGAGAAALIHQWWKKSHASLPSPAMVRALLVNGATDMGDNDVPNVNEGWGRINLAAVFAKGPAEFHDQDSTFSGPGQSRTYTVDVAPGSESLRVTLAWSDAPGAILKAPPAGPLSPPTLVNDLDLTVEFLGDRELTWRGNVFQGGMSALGGKVDRLNNLENVFLYNPLPGTYRITVRAHNIPGDGVPYEGDKTDQDFALVIRSTR
ncbi:MAG TPA: S8 family serine peptidase [Actinomycetota bacterium]|nr:S8 family serine peptidase [Actinomycetota bacterium]